MSRPPVALDYRYPTPLANATLRRRYQRFLADVRLPGGRVLTVHCANPGSMLGVDVPGRPVRIRDSRNSRRKLRWSLEQVRPARAWVCVNTALPNRVVEGALRRDAIEPLRGYTTVRREVAPGPGSRIDLLLTAPDDARCWIEVKNVTLREGREARFPDAVTTRGLKHLRELRTRVRQGERAVMLYFVGRADVDRFRPAWAIDPAYADGLRAAADEGVEILPIRARVTPRGLGVGPILPYDLGHG